MFKIDKKKSLVYVFLAFVFVIIIFGVFVGGIYFGESGKISFWDEVTKETGEKLFDSQKTYDLSSCNESTANITEVLSDSVVTVSVKKLNVKSDFNNILDPFDFFNFSPNSMDP